MRILGSAGRAFGAGVVAMLSMAAPAGAVLITGSGAALINPPYDTNHNYALDAGVTTNYGDPSTGLAGNWVIAGGPGPGEAVTQTYSGNSSGWSFLRNTVDVNGAAAYNQITRSTTYSVGTVIYDAVNFNSYPDTNNSTVNYTLRFANGSPGLTTANWSSINTAASGSVARGAAIPINIATLPTVLTATTFRIDYSTTQTRTDAGNQASYAIFDEALILPDRYQRVAYTPSSAPGTPTVSETKAADMDSGTRFLNQAGSGLQTFDMNFATPQRIDALVFYTYGNFPSDFLVRDVLTNQVVFSVSGVTSQGEVVPVQLTTPVTTSDLRIEFTRRGDNVAGMYEVIPLQLLAVPEPTSLGLLSVGTLTMLRRRRAKY